MASGRGAILAMPHLGGWDYGGAWFAATGYPSTVVVEQIDPPELFEFFREMRRGFGVDVVPLDKDAGPAILAALRRGGMIGLVCDRDITGTGIPVEMFGAPTTLPAGTGDARVAHGRRPAAGHRVLRGQRPASWGGASGHPRRAHRQAARRRHHRHPEARQRARAPHLDRAGAVARLPTELARPRRLASPRCKQRCCVAGDGGRRDSRIPLPGPGQVLVDVLACGICGSDLHFVKHGETMVDLAADAMPMPMNSTSAATS